MEPTQSRRITSTGGNFAGEKKEYDKEEIAGRILAPENLARIARCLSLRLASCGKNEFDDTARALKDIRSFLAFKED